MRALDTSQYSTLGAIAGLKVLVAQQASPGEIYRRLLDRAFVAIDERAQARTRLIEQECAELQRGGLAGGIMHELCEDGWRVEDEMVKSVFRALIQHAQNTFAAPGGKLQIQESDFREKFYADGVYDREDLRSVDPVRLWNALSERYGSGRGEHASYLQVARALRSFFRIKQDQSVKVVGGCVCLDHGVWLDDFDRKHCNRIALTHRAADDLVQAIPAFRAFSMWADVPELGAGYAKLADRFSSSPREVTSRERITLSRDAYVITYQTRFEFRFSSHIASQLQLFLSTFSEAE